MHLNSVACKCLAVIITGLVFTTVFTLQSLTDYGASEQNKFVIRNHSSSLNLHHIYKKIKFLEVPQIVWGLNNQKIAFARACLTARMMNGTLLMPSLSASLFYKEIDLLKPISFDKVFQFDRFNMLCNGFVQLGQYVDLLNQSNIIEIQKGSGRKWTIKRDLDQLRQFSKDMYDNYETVRIVGKNPFLWHDHWPVRDYARVFECLALVDEISEEVDKVVSKIRQIGKESKDEGRVSQNGVKTGFSSLLQPLPYVAVTTSYSSLLQPLPYVAVHMRIEKDWMIHCKKQESRLNISQICSSKEEIMKRVGNIVGLKNPMVVYLAVAYSLLEDNSILDGWKEGFLPYEKKKLGVLEIYNKHPYLIQSAIDYEVCSRASVFVGNSFSTFSSLIVLDRTQKMIREGVQTPCSVNVTRPSYAYNIVGESQGPRQWMTDMSASSLEAISYGSKDVSC